MVPNLSYPIAEHVVHALNQPIHKGLTRLDARRYISFYEQDDSHNKDLLNFAKIGFQLIAKVAPKGAKWWKDLDFAKKLPFARDRLVESYFWVLGVYFEPQYWLARRILTKVIAMSSIIDDIYDVYGTLEELALFTDAIERWEISALDKLPEYMKLCYQALLDIYSMIDEEMAKQGGSYRVDYAKSEMKNLVRGYFEEAKWFHQGYVPRMEEYMQVALLTSGYKMVTTTSFVGMGELATKEAFDWVSSFPLIVEAVSTITRLTDDIVGHKFEQQRGHVVSAVECYMKQHGAIEEEAIVELYDQVTNAWKDMNAECLYSTKVPMPLLVRVLNLARVINVLYKDEDSYTHSGTRTKNFITSVLIDSVPIN
ncbi:terpenoid cyclases/Protein prenyltransferases superfamily protein [Actinidia rufa]|uniref:Terpenoid cyclases/Protein prenyltransferases superfamily protein n=1 Tax=Actinidia rufa TaxID=165716 RepID=A0A7J0D7X0_9ERIC|nr:terpenoid cyclases/Protein prenyltransferases superfamily protein [Actinidia rufa]